MRSIAAQALMAVLLLGAGAALGLAGLAERRLTAANKALETLQYNVSSNQYAQIVESTQAARWLPMLGPRVQDAASAGQAEARYWLADYPAVDGQTASGRPEHDVEIAFLAANAMYRAIALDGNRQAALQRIDAVLRRYADLLKKDAAHVDAAYNFEYVARVRDTLERPRPATAKPDAKGRRAPSARQADDLPVGPTLHGSPGAPPRPVSMGEFKTLIPQQKEERSDEPDAAKSSRKVRKG
jgi:hypothetical protein